MQQSKELQRIIYQEVVVEVEFSNLLANFFISSHEYVPKAIFLSVLYEAETLLNKQYLSAMFGFKETDFAILYESVLNFVTTRNQLDNNIKERKK
jgi:hypothetical protein